MNYDAIDESIMSILAAYQITITPLTKTNGEAARRIVCGYTGYQCIIDDYAGNHLDTAAWLYEEITGAQSYYEATAKHNSEVLCFTEWLTETILETGLGGSDEPGVNVLSIHAQAVYVDLLERSAKQWEHNKAVYNTLRDVLSDEIYDELLEVLP